MMEIIATRIRADILLISANCVIILKIMYFVLLSNSDENNTRANCQEKCLLTM
jgi:hypothetical protein